MRLKARGESPLPANLSSSDTTSINRTRVIKAAHITPYGRYYHFCHVSGPTPGLWVNELQVKKQRKLPNARSASLQSRAPVESSSASSQQIKNHWKHSCGVSSTSSLGDRLHTDPHRDQPAVLKTNVTALPCPHTLRLTTNPQWNGQDRKARWETPDKLHTLHMFLR